MTTDLVTRVMAMTHSRAILPLIKRQKKGLRIPTVNSIAKAINKSKGVNSEKAIRETLTALETAGLITIHVQGGAQPDRVELTDAGWNMVGGKPAELAFWDRGENEVFSGRGPSPLDLTRYVRHP